MMPYLNVAKVCGYEKTGDCAFEVSYLNNRATINTWGAKSYKLILNDGSVLILRAQSRTDEIDGKYIPTAYLIVYMDINGKKGPNVFGRDIFQYNYTVKYDLTPTGRKDYSGIMMPDGYDSTRDSLKSKCNKNVEGHHCAALIMKDGWQIRDDYPW